MRAVYLTNRGLEIREVEEPKPGYGEVVIKVKYALTDGTDLKAFLWGHPILREGPFGHEYSGIVYSLGEGVEGFRVGDEVFGVNTAPCFKCENCMRGKFNLCENLKKNMVIGSYAEYLLIPQIHLNVCHVGALPEVVMPYKSVEVERRGCSHVDLIVFNYALLCYVVRYCLGGF